MKKQWIMMLTAMLFALPGLGMAQQYAYDYTIKVPLEVKNMAHRDYLDLTCMDAQGDIHFNKSAPINNGSYNGVVSFSLHKKLSEKQRKVKCYFMVGTNTRSGGSYTNRPEDLKLQKGAFFRSNTTITLKGRKL